MSCAYSTSQQHKTSLLAHLDSQSRSPEGEDTVTLGPFGVFRLNDTPLLPDEERDVEDIEIADTHHRDSPFSANMIFDDFLMNCTLDAADTVSMLDDSQLLLGLPADQLVGSSPPPDAFSLTYPPAMPIMYNVQVKDLDFATIRLLLDRYQHTLVPYFSPARIRSKSPWEALHIPKVHETLGEVMVRGDAGNSKVSLLFAVLSASAFHLGILGPSPDEVTSSWRMIGESYRDRAKARLKMSLQILSSGQREEDYKDVLMALLSMVTICVVSGDMEEGYAYLRDIEHLIALYGVDKIRKSADARMLHSTFLYLRTLQASVGIFGGQAEARSINGHLNSPQDLESNLMLADQKINLWSSLLRPDGHIEVSNFATEEPPCPTCGINTPIFEQIYSMPESLFRLISRVTTLAQRKEQLRSNQSLPAVTGDDDLLSVEARTSKPASRFPIDDLPNGTASVPSSKRKRAPEAGKEPLLKRTKIAPQSTRTSSDAARSALPLNKVPTQVLSIFPFGNGENCELGLGPNTTEALTPRVNPYLGPSNSSSKPCVVQVACGGMHTVVLTSDNKIVTWGVNDNWALGRDTEWDGVYQDAEEDASDEEEAELNPHESIPAAIPADSFPPGTRFVQVAAGDSCSFALTDDGLVYGWGTFRNASGDNEFGYDSHGQLIEKQKTPTCIVGLAKIVQITCGANHALALDAKGAVWGWGAHEQNQLGRRLLRRHQEHLKPRLIEVCRKRAKYIASGEYHSFAIDHKDNVWGWGLNSFGEAGYAKNAGGDSAILPYPMKIPGLCGKSVTVIAGGAHHSAAVTVDGKCLVWGRMDGGQLGISFSTEQLENEDVIRYDERNKPRICLRPTIIPNIGDAVHVACGTDHTIFVNKEGTAYATGFGTSGQLGLGSYRDVEVARPVKRTHLKDSALTWAGAGGQFSILAGPAKSG
ncbi:hypothetical protein QQX98_010500 [Neonectria punicea]|uniref:RCC1-like domain-containing protein n=1 Tax=Neonectria punicea TaxID=979145 RepID=A0ABR1GPV5_9HYPO